MTEENKPLLILSIVAIVAIVGIVLGLFGMSKTKVISPVGTAEEDLVGEASEVELLYDEEGNLVGEAAKPKTKSKTSTTTKPKKACTDSDHGKNIYVAGQATNKDGSGTFDYCDFAANPGIGYLMEAVCVKGSAQHTKIVCPSQSKYCNKAVCSSNPPVCTDTDGGIEPYIIGTVNVPYWGYDSPYTDYCEDIKTYEPFSSCTGAQCGVREFYCTEPLTGLGWNDVQCPNGCSNGACLVTIQS